MASTRRILAFDWLTADGYFAGADGNLNWAVLDDEQAKAAATGLPAADTLLFGRRTCELFEGFWLILAESLARLRHGAGSSPSGQQSREQRVLEGLSRSVTLDLLDAMKYQSGDVSLSYAARLAAAGC